jgi:hypothetical protein
MQRTSLFLFIGIILCSINLSLVASAKSYNYISLVSYTSKTCKAGTESAYIVQLNNKHCLNSTSSSYKSSYQMCTNSGVIQNYICTSRNCKSCKLDSQTLQSGQCIKSKINGTTSGIKGQCLNKFPTFGGTIELSPCALKGKTPKNPATYKKDFYALYIPIDSQVCSAKNPIAFSCSAKNEVTIKNCTDKACSKKCENLLTSKGSCYAGRYWVSCNHA